MKLNELIYEEDYLSSDIELTINIRGIATSVEEIKDGYILIVENPNKMPMAKDFLILPLAILSSYNAPFPNCIPKIKVSNPRLASSIIYSRFYRIDFTSLSVIGVTGTNGKTTTAYMIYKVLTDYNIKAGFIGTGRIEIREKKVSDITYSMTTPDPKKLYPILKKMQDEGCTKVVMEVSSHALALDKVTPIPFEYGVFTNLSPEHTDFHKTMDDYFSTKLKLLSASKSKVINIDDKYGRLAADMFEKSTTTIGVIWRGDYYATNIESDSDEEISYFTHTDKICYKTVLHFPGIYNVYNSLLAAAVCIDIGIPPCQVKKSLSEFQGVSGRFEVIKSKIKVIIDYAHTEDAYKNALRTLKCLKKNNHLTVVFGCGGERDRAKREKIASIVESYADTVIVTEDNSRNENPDIIFNDIKKGFTGKNHKIIKNRTEAIKEAVFSASLGDVVAIMGKGAEEYNIDKDGYHPYSDKNIVKSVLKEYENKP